MGTGEIRDFRKPAPERKPGVTVLSQIPGGNRGVQVSQEPQPVEVKLHEEVISEDPKAIRRRPPEEIEGLESVRIRTARDEESWEKVRKGKDQ